MAAIKTRSPQAAVFFVDYLALSTDKAHAPNPATYPDSCYLSLLYSQAFPFGAADTQYLAALEVLFNQTVDAAATKAGATVVSTVREESHPQSLRRDAGPVGQRDHHPAHVDAAHRNRLAHRRAAATDGDAHRLARDSAWAAPTCRSAACTRTSRVPSSRRSR